MCSDGNAYDDEAVQEYSNVLNCCWGEVGGNENFRKDLWKTVGKLGNDAHSVCSLDGIIVLIGQ